MKMTKIHKSLGGAAIAGNSVSVAGGDFVSFAAGFLVKATGSTGKIEGTALGAQTFASDNQTVAKAKMQYVKDVNRTEYECTIVGGTITAADAGVKYFLLNSDGNVDGTTESAVASYVKTDDTGAAVDAVVNFQVRLVKYISATKGIFELV